MAGQSDKIERRIDMAKPTGTEYLLKLSTNEAEYERFRKSKADAEQSMKEAGLDKRHQDLLLSGILTKPHAAVVEELTALRPSGIFPMITGGPMEEATLSIHFASPYWSDAAPRTEA